MSSCSMTGNCLFSNFISNSRYTSIRTCRIYVGSTGGVKLRNGKILEPEADGYVEFVGEIVCSKGGNTCCTMEECIDLYDKI